MNQADSKNRKEEARAATTHTTRRDWRDRLLTPRDKAAHAHQEEHTRKIEEENRRRLGEWKGEGGPFCGG